MSCKESSITQQQDFNHMPSCHYTDYNAVKANMAVRINSCWSSPNIHLWKEQNQFHQSRECRKLGFSSQGHTILPHDHHDLGTEGAPSYGALSNTTRKPSGAGKSSSCIHTAQKPRGHHHHSPLQKMCKAPVAVACPSGPTVHTLLPLTLG